MIKVVSYKFATPLGYLRACFVAVLLPSLPLFILPSARSEPQNNDTTVSSLFQLSMVELLQVKVSIGSLSETPRVNSPSSVTVISRQQIEVTPARNIRDLLEVYVPGLMFFDDSASGGNIRIRGLGERNYTTLLLINGRPINQKSYRGSLSELNNWDMKDIERIEVARGPGSVTHGPGAISGVINIITKKAGTFDGVTLGVVYNADYQGSGAYLDIGYAGEDVQWRTHMSMMRTQGYENLKIYQFSTSGEHGYKGDDEAFSGSDGNTVANFYGDADDKPQVKISFDIALYDNWHLSSRYSSSGNVGTVTNKEYLDGEQPTHEFREELFLLSLDNSYQINQQWQLESLLSFDSVNYYTTNAKRTEFEHNGILNRTQNHSENEWFARSLLTYSWNKDDSITTGIEYSHDYMAKPWGESANTFRAGSSKRYFISEDSLYRGDGSNGTIKDSNVVEYTDGWSANTYSLMTELKYHLRPKVQALLSARMDKNDFTSSMFSPRVALIANIDEHNTVKASWQQSLRMNTMTELYIEELEGNQNDPEKIEAFELSYNHIFNSQWYSNLTFYTYDTEIIAWSGKKSELVGNQKARGLELELAYQTNNVTFGMNHSYLKLDDWDFVAKEDDGSAFQKISLSDFFLRRGFLSLTSTGNSPTFWSNNTTKLWSDLSIGDDVILHFDARIMWELEYGNDLFTMYDNAYAAVDTSSLSPGELEDYSEGLQTLNEYQRTVDELEPFGRSIRLNASLTWDVPYFNNTILGLYVQNPFNFDNNKRQKSINFGSVPVSSWLEEPRAFWLTLDVEL